MPINEIIKIFRSRPKDLAASVFKFFPNIKKDIITSISQIEAANIIEKLYSDDTTALIEEMPTNVVKKILANTTPESRNTINMLL